ncbi:MAG: MATE family efflux transporter [Rhodospirillaceae bacterium]|nr:MATE family efflux transporter [Rhodospirillaceae bacterium]
MPNNNLFSASTSLIERHRQVFRLALPIIVANLSVPLLGAVDTAVMGHLEHAHFLGAVAVGATIIHFIYWGFGFLRMGTTGLTAQAFGANQTSEVRANFQRAALLGVVIGMALWALQYPIINFALHLFDASETVENLARSYFQIRIWSAPAVLVNYCLIGWFIGVHNTRFTLILQVWMNCINIILDLVFVVGFGWGVEGVAIATVIAEVSAVILGLYLYRTQIQKIDKSGKKSDLLNFDKLRRMISVNTDIFIRTFCLIFAFTYFAAEAAKFGDEVLAANAVLLQFMHFMAFGLDGFAQAAEALVGSALGAKDRFTFREAVKTSTIWALIVSLAFTLVYWALGTLIIDLLTDLEEVRIAAKDALTWPIILPVIAVWPYMLDGIFIGATRSAEMRNGMIISLVVFIAAVLVLKAEYGYHGLWFALTLFMVVRGVTLGVVYPRIERSLN